MTTTDIAPTNTDATRMGGKKVFYNSWGYGQTNIDFYVVERESASNVWLRRITSRHTENVGYMQDRVVAGDSYSDLDTKVYRRKKFTCDDRQYCNSPSGFGACCLWGGEPLTETSYA
jgi:hypothetical protein